MKPINKKDRKAAMIKFILAYVLTVLVLIIPLYAVYKIPEKQCDVDTQRISKLEKDFEKCRKERDKLINKDTLSVKYKKKLEKIYSDYLSSYSKLDENVNALDNLINSGSDIWNQPRIDTIIAENGVIYQSRNELKRINDNFSKLLNKK